MSIGPEQILEDTLDVLEGLPRVGPFVALARDLARFFGSPDRAREHLDKLRADELEARKDRDERMGR